MSTQRPSIAHPDSQGHIETSPRSKYRAESTEGEVSGGGGRGQWADSQKIIGSITGEALRQCGNHAA